MNPFCPHCGFRLRMAIMDHHFECEGCGEIRDFYAVMTDDRPEPAHGERCGACAGEGNVEVSFTQWHPYGDTSVPEDLTDYETCPDCEGRGYFLDEDTCIVCSKAVKRGVLVEGWEVHEECAQDTVPALEVDSNDKP